MANLQTAVNRILIHEGGYTCAFPGSGETYKGIDRNYSKDWKGWQIVDTAKQQGSLDKFCSKRNQIIKSSLLDNHVHSWYNKTLVQYLGNFSAIKNQTLATFIADFVWHKPYRAIFIVNEIAKKFNPTVHTNPHQLTNSVIDVINNNSHFFYAALRANRIRYYNNPKSINTAWNERFITSKKGLLNRVNSFPPYLTVWSWFLK